MLYQSCWNNLVTGLIVPSSLLQFVNSLFQTCSNKFGTSSANTSCEQLVNRLVTTCLQVCSNLCVFTCVVILTLVFTRVSTNVLKQKKIRCCIGLKINVPNDIQVQVDFRGISWHFVTPEPQSYGELLSLIHSYVKNVNISASFFMYENDEGDLVLLASGNR